MEQRYELTDGSYNFAIVNGKLQTIHNYTYSSGLPGWKDKKFKILAENCNLPAHQYPFDHHGKEKNDTIIISEDGLVMFTQKRFLKPTPCPYCGR